MKKINHQETEILCSAERRVLKAINANCNSPVSVYAKLEDKEIIIQSILYDHDGAQLFSDQVNGPKEESINIANQLGEKILNDVGKERINQLDFLKNDFNYSP
jgi:hydroxymethylbilane synthase